MKRSKTKNFGKWLQSCFKQNAPTILTCMSAVGVVTTAVLAVKATPRADLLIKDDSRKKHDGDPYAFTKAEAVCSCWHCYIPAISIGIGTILCIFGANTLNKRRQASLMSAYALLDGSYKRYKQAAKEIYGKDADTKIQAQAAKDVSISADGYRTYVPEIERNGDILFFDSYSGRYFTSTAAAVVDAIYHTNRNFILKGLITLNEFYEFLGLDKIDGGDDIGWNADDMLESGLMWIDFDNSLAKMDDGLECVILTMIQEPAHEAIPF